MKNYVQPGNTITLTAPYAVTSGDGLLVGSIFGIASGDAALNDPVETTNSSGVFDLTKVGSQAWTVGAKGLLGRHQQAHHERGHIEHVDRRCDRGRGRRGR
jgi:predicted RecA/RadA family phage recombinase